MTSMQEQNKKKGGRPPTGRVRKLSKSVTVKFSKPSYEALRLRARKANRKLAEYIRESALNGEVVSGHNAEMVAIAKNLIGMANNLNQLTKLSHQRGFHETHVYVMDLLRRLKARGCVKTPKNSQSPDFPKPGLCYVQKFLYL